MTKRRYQSDRAITSAFINHEPPTGDTSRTHAVNYAIGVALLALVAYIAVWSFSVVLIDGIPFWTLLLCVPVAISAGIAFGAAKLLSFTEMHRAYLYGLESVLGIDIDGDGSVGEPTTPQTGTLLLGVDDRYHRIDTTLTTTEIDQVRRLLLLSHKATVRALAAIVGDRASHLRAELIGLHICARPERDNAAAPVSDAGRKVLTRW